MNKLTATLILVFFVAISSVHAADCGTVIARDRPLLGIVGTIVKVKMSPLSDPQDIRYFGPGFKYSYTVQYKNGTKFRSYVVYPDTSRQFRVGYRFAWIPVAIATGGRVRDNNRFTPTAYDRRCRPMNLDVAWKRRDIFVPQ